MTKGRAKRIAFARGLSSDCSPCRRVVRGNACSGNTAAHTAPLPAAALRQCLVAIFLNRQRFIGCSVFYSPCRFPCFPVATQWAQRKPPSGSGFKEHSYGSLFEVTPVGDYGKLLLRAAVQLRCPVRFRSARH